MKHFIRLSGFVLAAVSAFGYTYPYSWPNGAGSWSGNGGSTFLLNVQNSPLSGDTYRYEVKATLTLKQSGGNYAVLFRASSNANAETSTGTYYSIEVQNPVFTGPDCSATLVYKKVINGQVSTPSAMTIPCRDQMVQRLISHSTGAAGVYVDNVWTLWMGDPDIAYTAGVPGVAGWYIPSVNGIRAEVGPFDGIGPNAVPVSGIGD